MEEGIIPRNKHRIYDIKVLNLQGKKLGYSLRKNSQNLRERTRKKITQAGDPCELHGDEVTQGSSRLGNRQQGSCRL